AWRCANLPARPSLLALELRDGAFDAIECPVQILHRSGVRNSDVIRCSEVVAADQRNVPLVEQKPGEPVAVGDFLVAKAAAEQLRYVGENVKRALRYI